MAKNVKNKYPADKTGTKYSEFRNTKRNAAAKVVVDRDNRQSAPADQTANKTA